MKKYLAHKDSGIEWLEALPVDWRVELRKIKIPVGNGHLFIHQQKLFKIGANDSMELVHA